MTQIRTWHAPDSTKEAARAVFGEPTSTPAPSKPPVKPTAPGPAPTAVVQPRPARPDDDLGWLRPRIGRRVEVTFLTGTTVRGFLARVARYEFTIREALDQPEWLIMKHGVASVREAGDG